MKFMLMFLSHELLEGELSLSQNSEDGPIDDTWAIYKMAVNTIPMVFPHLKSI
jgi:hypothetical protein